MNVRYRARYVCASMRPRGIPRGKPACAVSTCRPRPRFNEAAGNTPRKTTVVAALPASTPDCFNEAAGNTPRKTAPAGYVAAPQSCFNEAAGNTPRKTHRTPAD